MNKENPIVSIVIPCRNEEAYITKCLDSIVACNFDKKRLQVIVCDGMSEDKTPELILAYSQQFPFIHYTENKEKTTPQAFNLGFKQFVFDIGIILGAHAEIDKDYITNCLKAFDVDPEIGCVGGVIENVNENQTSEAIGLAMSSVFGVGNAHFRTGTKSGFVDTVAFGAYKKEVFETCGYFDEELIRNQDDEFNFRIQKFGFKIWLEPTVKSKYYVRASFKKLSRQYFQYGYWKVYVNRKHKAITTLRQLVPAVWVLYLFLGFIPGFFFTSLFYLYASGVFLYLMLSKFAALKTANHFRQVPQILYAFWILHFSYGRGYIKGIFDFIVMGKKPAQKQAELTR